ncbi:MAG: 23S rRNA (guanosine(2251)-2'-O)-methyltransferase RlmB [Chloroflexota bacterium]
MDLLYGRNAVREALRAPRHIHRVLIAEGTHGLEEHIAAARERQIPMQYGPRQTLDEWVGAHHQGIAAEAEAFPYVTVDRILGIAQERGEPPFVLVLDSLQDPQNFGTLLRTAQASGVHGVVIPEHRAVAVTPGVSNASAGAVEHLAVARVTNLSRALRSLKERGVWVYGLAADATEPYWQADLRGPAALVVGSEGHGISRLVRETCDVVITIPMASDAVESLNAAVAGSLVVYDAFRQRGL